MGCSKSGIWMNIKADVSDISQALSAFELDSNFGLRLALCSSLNLSAMNIIEFRKKNWRYRKEKEQV